MHMDMPLEELKKYQGKNPKPSDFEEYWDRALKELGQQSLNYELVEADFQTPFADCYHLTFTGVGDAKVYAKFIKPKKHIATGQAVAMFHGYSVDSGDWLDKLAFAAQGITVLALDCRGQGGRSEDTLRTKATTMRGLIIRGLNDKNPDNLYYRNVFLDTVQTVRILQAMEDVDAKRIGVYGGSQGGALALACAALENTVKEAVVIYPFLTDYLRVWEMDIQNSAYGEIAEFFRNTDPTHERHEEFFTKLGYIDIQHHAPNIKANVDWYIGLRDQICPPSSQFAAYNKLTSKKTMKIYYEFGHEHLPHVGDYALQKLSKNL